MYAFQGGSKRHFSHLLELHFFSPKTVFPSIYTYLEYGILWQNRISCTIEKKK